MKDLSKTPVEEAIARYCLSLFRNALKQSTDIGKALEYCNEKSKAEKYMQ